MKKFFRFVLLLMFVFCCFIGCYKNQTTPDNETAKESEDFITQIIGENVLNRDLSISPEDVTHALEEREDVVFALESI